MRTIPIALAGLIVGFTLPVYSQSGNWSTLERSFRPHVHQAGFQGVSRTAAPPRKAFALGGKEYATWLSAEALASSPDWQFSAPFPVESSRLEQIAREALVKVVTNAAPWYVSSLQVLSAPGSQSLKWYFLVEMKPFWGPGPLGSADIEESFWLAIDLSGKPGVIGQKIAENQWRLIR